MKLPRLLAMPPQPANDQERQGDAGASLDHALCQDMASLVESLTTSGKPALDKDLMKQLKKLCKNSDAYVEHCFQLVNSQLQEDHAEIRLSAFQVINELFTRSHRFRELLVADMQEYLELTMETNVELPLPPPKPAAKILKEQALRAMQDWHTRFGKAYKKLGLGYTYLKNCKKVDFVNIQARSDAERRRAEERERRLQLAQAQKLTQITQEMNETIPEIEECLTQCENCFQLLLPNMAFNENQDAVSMATDQNHPSSSKSSLSQSRTVSKETGSSSNGKDVPRENVDERTISGKSRIHVKNKNTRTEVVDGDVSANQRNFDNVTAAAPPGRSIFDIDEDDVEQTDGVTEGARTDEKEEEKQKEVMEECITDDETRTTCYSEKSENGVHAGTEQISADDADMDDPDSGDGEGEKEEEDEAEEMEGGGRERSNLQQHGLPSWTSISISIDVGSAGVALQEDEDNTDVLLTLDDQQRLLTTRFLTKINAWTEALTKMGKADRAKRLIDLKVEIQAKLDKYKELRVKRVLPHRAKSSGSSSGVKDPGRRGAKKMKETEYDEYDEDDDDDSDDGFDAVPEKEGYESDIPEDLKEEFGIDVRPSPKLDQSKSKPKPKAQDQAAGTSAIDWHPVRDADSDLLDPASQAGSIVAMKEKLRKIRDQTTLNPGYHVIPPKKEVKKLSEEELKRKEMLKKAPVLAFGTDLAYWENPEDFQAPVVLRPDTTSRTWISSVQEEEVVLESAKDSLRTRVMNFTGSFKPVKWKCRAPLPDGRLCERMDREKCPFHGTIIARDVLGFPQKKAEQGQSSTSKTGATAEDTPAWQDPELLRDVEAATGRDLGSSSSSKSGKGGKGKGSGKKGKGKAKKYPGLTDISKINNTSRNRLEKIVMNRGSVKRVAAAMNKVDRKRVMDKFGNNFNYALN